jgi:glyoxylase-like metal-dependent hydrolase (beta-lactamase superfamily II)
VSYEVTAIRYGDQMFPGPAVFWSRRWFEWVRLDLYFWLVRGNGRTVLVDTGMSADHCEAVNAHVTGWIGNEAALRVTVEPLDALAALGVAPEDVDHVVITHAHLDHVSNVAKFPNATFVTSRRGFQWILDPPHPVLVNEIAVPPHAVRFLDEDARAAGRLRLTEDREEVLPGLVTVRTGGHTFDHQVVLIDTAVGRVGLAVDNAMMYESLESMIPCGSPHDLEAAIESLELLAREADLIVPGHDPAVTARFPGGRIA